MPRRLRCASAGFVYHVLNRAVARARIFEKTGDYQAFEKVLRQADAFVPMRLLAYCIRKTKGVGNVCWLMRSLVRVGSSR